jgi:hypothetical protein
MAQAKTETTTMIEIFTNHATLNVATSITHSGRKADRWMVRLWVGPTFTIRTFSNKKEATAFAKEALAA